MPTDLRTDITNALHAFTGGDLTANCSHLLDVLGYRSEKRYPLEPNTAQNFVATFATARPFNAEHALTDAWTEANVLFQLTDREVAQREQMDLALDDGGWNRGLYRSFLFLAVGLSGERYSRSALATITRAVNRNRSSSISHVPTACAASRPSMSASRIWPNNDRGNRRLILIPCARPWLRRDNPRCAPS